MLGNSGHRKMCLAFLVPILGVLTSGAHASDVRQSQLQQILSQGHNLAKRIGDWLQPGALQGSSPSLAAWMEANSAVFSEDLASSKIVWVDDVFATCARTQREPQADILLSKVTCLSTVSTLEEATELLLHETVHHSRMLGNFYSASKKRRRTKCCLQN